MHVYLYSLTRVALLRKIKMSNHDKGVLTVFSVRKKPMTVTEVTSLHQDLPEEVVSTLPPVRARDGEVYINL